MSRFDKLSHFATKYIPTKSTKARKFEWGPDHTLKEKVVGLRLPIYAQVVQATLINERELNDYYKIGDEKRATPQQREHIRNNNQGYVAPKPYSQNNPRPHQHNQPWRNPNPNPNSNPNQGQFQLQNQYPPQNRNLRCFHCNQEGHFRSNRPQLVGSGSSGYGGQNQNQNKPTGFSNQFRGQNQPHIGWNQQQSRPPQNNGVNGQMQPAAGRAFALQGTKEELDPSVIQDTFILYTTFVQALFDSGVSHSFISAVCVSALGLETEPLKTTLHVTSTLGGKISVVQIYKECELEVSNLRITCDLRVIEMTDFDVILGMDWLTAH
ncbi:uncharacterized protein LOC131323635 [Rhododendron vialii]|uniref:uncharacterized protein LOC131323635 n=1 Tax=Rhododendron vialii TaxID=182163 RepID=UPI00265E29C5|nr:uncharacterized protein LOC131323635 [Rhododendron vialii]